MSNYILELPLEPPSPPPDCICEECGNWFYGDERIYISNGRKLCPECFDEEFDELTTDEKADFVGAEKTTAEELNDNGRMRFCIR